MPAIAVVASSRAAARTRRCTGTREISSTVSSRARGGQAAMSCATGSGRACSTLAATLAATPSTRVARTAQRTRRSWRSGSWGVVTGSSSSVWSVSRVSGGVAGQPAGATGAAFEVGDEPVGQRDGVLAGFGVDLGHPPGQQPAQVADAIDGVGVAEAGVQVHGLLVERLVVRVVVDRGAEHGDRLGRVVIG